MLTQEYPRFYGGRFFAYVALAVRVCGTTTENNNNKLIFNYCLCLSNVYWARSGPSSWARRCGRWRYYPFYWRRLVLCANRSFIFSIISSGRDEICNSWLPYLYEMTWQSTSTWRWSGLPATECMFACVTWHCLFHRRICLFTCGVALARWYLIIVDGGCHMEVRRDRRIYHGFEYFVGFYACVCVSFR